MQRRRLELRTLRTYPFIRIWHAGCSTGEEVYSLAILLREEGLYDRCRIYATDINEYVLTKAREGIFPLRSMQDYTLNYQRAGGKRSFSEYYTAAYDYALFDASRMWRLLDHGIVLLAAAIAEPATHVARLPLLTPGEGERLRAIRGRRREVWPRSRARRRRARQRERSSPAHPSSTGSRRPRAARPSCACGPAGRASAASPPRPQAR